VNKTATVETYETLLVKKQHIQERIQQLQQSLQSTETVTQQEDEDDLDAYMNMIGQQVEQEKATTAQRELAQAQEEIARLDKLLAIAQPTALPTPLPPPQSTPQKPPPAFKRPKVVHETDVVDWQPPTNQKGDGTTTLNDTYGY
jgi:uncharacterized membrane protein YccC